MQIQSRTDPSFQVHHINFIYDHQSIHLYFNNTKIQQNDVTYVYNYRVNLQKLIYRLIVIFSDGSARKGLQITKDFKLEPQTFYLNIFCIFYYKRKIRAFVFCLFTNLQLHVMNRNSIICNYLNSKLQSVLHKKKSKGIS